MLENAAHLGLPVPEKLKAILEQLHNREINGSEGAGLPQEPEDSDTGSHPGNQ